MHRGEAAARVWLECGEQLFVAAEKKPQTLPWLQSGRRRITTTRLPWLFAPDLSQFPALESPHAVSGRGSHKPTISCPRNTSPDWPGVASSSRPPPPPHELIRSASSTSIGESREQIAETFDCFLKPPAGLASPPDIAHPVIVIYKLTYPY